MEWKNLSKDGREKNPYVCIADMTNILFLSETFFAVFCHVDVTQDREVLVYGIFIFLDIAFFHVFDTPFFYGNNISGYGAKIHTTEFPNLDLRGENLMKTMLEWFAQYAGEVAGYRIRNRPGGQGRY